MLAFDSPAPGAPTLRPKYGRKPLQPWNSPAANRTKKATLTPTSKASNLVWEANKENLSLPSYGASPGTTTATKIESFDASLAEELSAVRKKVERLRLERDRTEEMLRERDLVLEKRMREIQIRGEDQKRFEIEVDRLFRLKQLQTCSSEISPLRSLRQKVRGENIEEQVQSQSQVFQGAKVDGDDGVESVGENSFESPSSVS